MIFSSCLYTATHSQFLGLPFIFSFHQGGDLIKWDKAKIGYYVGIDIAEGSVSVTIYCTGFPYPDCLYNHFHHIILTCI
jgi:hypothetical protein